MLCRQQCQRISWRTNSREFRSRHVTPQAFFLLPKIAAVKLEPFYSEVCVSRTAYAVPLYVKNNVDIKFHEFLKKKRERKGTKIEIHRPLSIAGKRRRFYFIFNVSLQSRSMQSPINERPNDLSLPPFSSASSLNFKNTIRIRNQLVPRNKYLRFTLLNVNNEDSHGALFFFPLVHFIVYSSHFPPHPTHRHPSSFSR